MNLLVRRSETISIVECNTTVLVLANIFQRCAMSSHVGSTILTLPESHEMLRKTCRDFADRELKPIAAELDKTHRYPTDIVRRLAHRASFDE